MGTGVEILHFLIQTAAGLFLFAVIMRLLLQLCRADFYNPISQTIVKVTDPLLKPLRKVIPGFAGIDFAAVVLALAIQFVSISALLLLYGLGLFNPLIILAWSVIGIAALIVRFYFFAIIGMIILSWVAQGVYHPAILLLHQLTEPVMTPFRRLLPPLGGLDLSPILVFILINVTEIMLRGLAGGLNLPSALVVGI